MDLQLIRDAEARSTGANCHSINKAVFYYKYWYDQLARAAGDHKLYLQRHIADCEVRLRTFVSTGDVKSFTIYDLLW